MPFSRIVRAMKSKKQLLALLALITFSAVASEDMKTACDNAERFLPKSTHIGTKFEALILGKLPNIPAHYEDTCTFWSKVDVDLDIANEAIVPIYSACIDMGGKAFIRLRSMPKSKTVYDNRGLAVVCHRLLEY